MSEVKVWCIMPNKRKNRNATKKYFCPFCEQRLWRLGSSKYYLFYKDFIEIRQNTNISKKNARFIAVHNTTYLDNKKWIEAFCCPEHGLQWILTSLLENGYEYRLAREKDWLMTNKTIDPRMPNPSVGEFTLKMSRKLSCN